MNKTIRFYLIALFMLFVGAIVIEFSKPRPINWTKTYNETHRIPYGTYIFFQELNALFPQSEILQIDDTPYEYFESYFNWENANYDIEGTYMYVDEAMTVDEISANKLLDYAYMGNDIFIASSYLPQIIKDSLQLETSNTFDFTGEAEMRFANPQLEKDSIRISKGLNNIYFSELDSLSTTVLGYQRFTTEDKVNFVEISYGGGKFIIHLQPVIFTNYHLLKDNNKKFGAAVLSYLSDSDIIYDKRNKTRYDLSQSPFRFILSKPALRWAWILALISVLIFLIFNAKRRQRVIPVIKPLENTTVAFTKTIGNLYYETKDHTNIIEKKINYLFEYIRRTYFIDTSELDEKFIRALYRKSGKSEDVVRKMINQIILIRKKRILSENDLIQLNKKIEDFYKT